MNIKGINNLTSINYYKNITSTKTNKENLVGNIDRIEISNESRNLLENRNTNYYDNKEKINNIKNQVSNGTYTYDAKLIAKSMINSMRGIE